MTQSSEPGPISRLELDSADVRRLNWFGAKQALARLLAMPGLNAAVRGAAKIMLPPAMARRLPLNKASVTYHLDDGSKIVLLDPLHDAVARDIWHGAGKPTDAAERHKLRVFEQIAKSSRTCLDIGAYAGIFALVAARANPDLRSVAFEIVPENYLLLLRNIIANDLVERVEPRLRGLAASGGSMKIPQAFGAASLMSSISLGSKFAHGVSIPLARLDDELQGVPGPVLIKIDVEGFESDIFLGGANFIREYRPDIICEILPGANQSCEIISEMLAPLGYRFYCFEDHAAEHAPCVATRARMRDWLFTTKSAAWPSLDTRRD